MPTKHTPYVIGAEPGARRQAAGFTLIELVIAVAIVGILMAIAIPAYTEQVRTTRRANARAAVMDVVQAMERFNTVNSTFVGAPCVATPELYTVACTNLTALTFTITAAPTAGSAQAADKCGSMVINQAGQRTVTGAATGVTAADCW